MIDKELSELKNNIPDIDIKDYKNDVYKKQDKKQKRTKVMFNYRLILICCLLGILTFCSFIIFGNISNTPNDQPSNDNPDINGTDDRLSSSNDKAFYANKFEMNNNLDSDDIITPYETTFIEFDKPWYKIKANNISEYICLYLDNKVYEKIWEVVFHECCSFYTEVKDGKEYVYCNFIGIERLKVEEIKKVDGIFANLYFSLLSGIKTFKVNDEYLNLQEYLKYIGSDIVISEENYIVKNSKNINDLPIQEENYIAIAYFYYQEFDYLYNYVTKEQVFKTVPYYGSMVACKNVNENIYYNSLNNSKEYLLMDVPLKARGSCCEFFENLKYNYTGEKEFIAFEINNLNNSEYVCLEDNYDVPTITLLSNGENYDVLFKEKVNINGNEYYSINELLDINKYIIEQWKTIYEYNVKKYVSSLDKLRSIVPNKFADEFKIATYFDSLNHDFDIDTITSGMVIYETSSEVTNMEPPSTKVGLDYFNKTYVIIEQFSVCFMLEVYGKDINEVKDLISAQWVNDGDVNKLVIIYDDSLIGEKVTILCQYERKRYHHQYTSFLGATIDCYTNCSLHEYVRVNLG